MAAVAENPDEANVMSVNVGGVFDSWGVCQITKEEVEIDIPEVPEGWVEVRRKRGRGVKKLVAGHGQGCRDSCCEKLEEKEVFVCPVEKEETSVLEMGFEVTDVKRALAAVSRITSKGNVVVFGEKEGEDYIEHAQTGRRIMMRRKNGAYVVDARLVGSGEAVEIYVDSAAEESVCPRDWAKEFGMTAVAKGKEMKLAGANGSRIGHYGKRMIKVEAPVF